jgi:predicted SAM-dependent methyltransferase
VGANNWESVIPDGSIDSIIAASVLEHINDRQMVLSLMASKLTPTGRIVISCPTENLLYRLGRKIVGFSGDYHLAKAFDVFADIQAVGFNMVYLRQWPMPGPLCLYQIATFTYPRAQV